ncbi:MAG: hypothetical protein R3E66_23270 [bacterium]
MGHRANYVIREDGRISLYYGQWGALTVPEDIFWGPAEAEKFIRKQQVVSPLQWLDDVWGEGGVALNKDTKCITLFGGEIITYEPYRSTFLKLMKALWATHGWTVEWAEVGMPAIAAAVGVDPTIATANPIPPQAADLATIGTRVFDEDLRVTCLVTLVDGSIHHMVSDTTATAMLANGQKVLSVLETLPDLDEVMPFWEKPEMFADDTWTFGDELQASVIVWVNERRIAFRELYANDAALGFISGYWMGWDVERFEGSVEKHFELLGLPVPKGLESIETVIEEFRADVTEDESIEEIARILMSKRPRKGAKETPEADDFDKVAIFGEALAAYSREAIRI